jgi:hypothetical protein
MAVVYPWCNDRAAHSADCRRGLHLAAVILRDVAATRLRGHASEFHSRIELEKGHLDYFIVLNDMRGDKAAAAIEYGRRSARFGNTPGKGALRFLLGG